MDKKQHESPLGFRKHVVAEFAPLAKAMPRDEIPAYVREGPRSTWCDILLMLQMEVDERTKDFLGKICHWMTACYLHGLYVLVLVKAGDVAGANAHVILHKL